MPRSYTHHEWTAAEVSALSRMFVEGLPDLDIAARLGVSIKQVQIKRRSLGLIDDSKARRVYKSTHDIDERIARFHALIDERKPLFPNRRRDPTDDS